jgi:hypothetical protein
MPPLWTSLFRASALFAETGLQAMDATLRSMQSAVDRVAGAEPSPPRDHPPHDGPPTVDDAVSEWTNRMGRIVRASHPSLGGLRHAAHDVYDSTRQSFAAVGLEDPRRWPELGLRMPLSFATLLTQEGLRILHSSLVVGPEHTAEFVSYIGEAFTDLHVFLSLQYKELTARYEEDVHRHPESARAHLRLGILYLRTGLFEQADRELQLAARDERHRAAALFEAAIVRYRWARFEDAVEAAAGSLAADATNERCRFWLFLAAQKLGGYPAHIGPALRMEAASGRARTTVELEDVASRIGLDKTSGGRGTAVFDLDGDGRLDVVIASANSGCSVYRNNGDGTFRDATVGSGLDTCVNTFALAVGDYDNDGRDDLYVARLGFYSGEGVLFNNNGDGTFTDVTREAGVGSWGPAFTVHWVDYDGDGHLDLFVANNLGGLFDRKTPNRLFHNQGNGTFREVAAAAGLHSPSPTIGAAWGDYDNDGYPDLFLSSGVGRAQLFHNNRDGTFTEVGREAGLGDLAFGSVCFWCDYDDDGWLDLVQFVWSRHVDAIHTLTRGQGPPEGRPMRIYHNNRDGTFTRRDRELGLTGCWGTMSGNAGDFDNDGHLDFLLGNGDPHMERTEPAVLLANDGRGRFRDVTFTAGLPYTGKGHGANMADLAGDGRLCLILADGGSYPADLMTTSVFRPKTRPGHYLNVRLVGTRSNRSAIGARVRLDAGGRSQHRLVNGGSGFGCLPLEQHFGLGTLSSVDAIHVLWPSGRRQEIGALPADQTIRIVEGTDGWERVY